MTMTSAGPGSDKGGPSEPKEGERAPDSAGTSGNAEKGGKPSPGGRDRDESASADDSASTGLDTAHDRAS